MLGGAGRTDEDAREARALLRCGIAGTSAGAGAREVKKGEEAMPGAGVMMMLVVLAPLLEGGREEMPVGWAQGLGVVFAVVAATSATAAAGSGVSSWF